MKRKLFANIRHVTSLFSVAIICVTLMALMLRLTVFSEMAVMAAANPGRGQGRIISNPEPGFFPYSLSRNVHFATPGSRGNFMITNPATNEFYMTVSVILPETGENVMFTGFIRPGDTLESLPLDIQLEEGIHECIAEITAFDPETLTPRGSEQIPITLHIG